MKTACRGIFMVRPKIFTVYVNIYRANLYSTKYGCNGLKPKKINFDTPPLYMFYKVVAHPEKFV